MSSLHSIIPGVILALGLSSCAMLDKVIPIFDSDSGEQVGETTVGDLAADTVENSSGFISNAVSTVIGGATGNPALGGLASLAALAGLGSAAGAMRKKQGVVVEEDEAPPPPPPAKKKKKTATK